MPAPKRVLCIMDMACVGRASLSVVLPTLAALGVQACPMPTSLFSTHTGGFGTVVVSDKSDFCENALEHYKEQGIEFDAIYTGYLQEKAQFDFAKKALAQYPNALKLVDPAMGDNGKTYSKITNDMVLRMQELCLLADVITPNFTESALLLDENPLIISTKEKLEKRILTLAHAKRSVLITSAPIGSHQGIIGIAQKELLPFTINIYPVPQNYPGTGDIFASCILGLLLKGFSLQSAANTAHQFVANAAKATFAAGGEPRQGLCFEPLLHQLSSL